MYLKPKVHLWQPRLNLLCAILAKGMLTAHLPLLCVSQYEHTSVCACRDQMQPLISHLPYMATQGMPHQKHALPCNCPTIMSPAGLYDCMCYSCCYCCTLRCTEQAGLALNGQLNVSHYHLTGRHTFVHCHLTDLSASSLALTASSLALTISSPDLTFSPLGLLPFTGILKQSSCKGTVER